MATLIWTRWMIHLANDANDALVSVILLEKM